MKSRPCLNLRCPTCGRLVFARRLRGPWLGVVQLVGEFGSDGLHPVVQLTPTPDGYSNIYPCRTCRPSTET